MGMRRALGVTALIGLGLLPVATASAEEVRQPSGERQSIEELRNTVINLLQALVDQGVISREKAAQMVKAAQDKAAAEAAAQAAQAKAEEGAVRVPYVPQIVKDEIAKQVAEEVKPAVTQDVIQEAKTEKWGVPGALPDWLARVHLYGEVTLREEGILYDPNNAHDQFFNYYGINTAGSIAKAGQNAFLEDNEDRVRFRGRARLGVDGALSDSVTAGMRLVTGNTSDLVSETQTLDGSLPYQFGLDELFIRFDERDAQRFPYLTAVVGRFLNPYGTPTNLIFHRDLTFTGAAATFRVALGDVDPDQSHFFFTLGGHPLQEIQFSAQDKWLVAGEIGSYLHWDETQHLWLRGAFFDYFNVTGRINPPGSPGLYNYTAPQFVRYGNTMVDIANGADPTTNLFAYASKFRLGNFNATYAVDIGRYQLSWTVDGVKNFGFNYQQILNLTGTPPASRTRDLGGQTEVAFGDPQVLKRGAWRALVGYRYLQGDAVMDAYTDSDFHYFGGTNARGYYFVVDYGLANGLWTRFRYLSANEVDGPTYGINTLQLDLWASF
ncbi:MAG TPA: putative porin [Steroidobacteraceae bacterium]|nr:putative porin [Steroidobacteraceae bacterium]